MPDARDLHPSMAKETSTAIALLADKLDWTRLERVRGAWRVEGSGETVVEAVADSADGAAPRRPQAVPAVPERFTLCLASANVLFRSLVLPSTDAAEVADMVALQLDKVLPLPAEEMTVSHETLGNDELNTRVLACAVPTAVVAAAVERLGVATDRVRRVDVAPLAAVRLLHEKKIDLAEHREAVLLDEDGDVALVLLDGGVPILARSLGAIGAAPAEILRALRLSLVQAEVEQGPNALERVTFVSARTAAEVLRAAASAAFGCPARVLAPADLGTCSRGAALRSHEPGTLDLTPGSWRSSVSDRKFRRRLLQVVGGGLLVWALLAGALYGGPAFLDRRAARIGEAIRVLEPSARSVRDVQNRVRMIQAYMDRELSSLEVLREVSALLPEGIDLGSFRYRRDERRVSMQGTAQSTPLVYEFKQRIDASPLFAESALVSGPTIRPRTSVAEFELLVLFKEEQP